jgi:hypothetical protein
MRVRDVGRLDRGRCAASALCAASLVATLAGGTGCATLWAGVKLTTGASIAPHENARRETVPTPGLNEELEVIIYPAGLPKTASSTTSSASGTAPTAPASGTGTSATAVSTPAPQVVCEVRQGGSETEYRASTRYGSRWKFATAVWFVVDALGAVAYYIQREEEPGAILASGFFAVDAVGTAALFFAPSRDEYTAAESYRSWTVRSDCPDGLTLVVGGRSVPVDAAGALGFLGEEALTEAMAEPASVIEVQIGAWSGVIRPDPSQRCAWLRARRSPQSREVCTAATTRGRAPRVVIPVAPGALTSAPADAL